ncbi:MAG: ribonuclease P protein component [Nocardioides sp.]
MLAADSRLTASAEFARAVRRGRRSSAATLVVHRLCGAQRGVDDEQLDPTIKVGFVVSKAVGGAVTRNRVKRRLRHLVREQWAVMEPGDHVVVRALPRSASASSAELSDDLARCLRGAR